MVHSYESFRVADGESVAAADAREVLAGAELVYDDGAIQQFSADGTTIYVEAGHRTVGEWSVADDGSFSSFWPPSFRARYALSWRVENQMVVGLNFQSDGASSVSSGRFQPQAN